MYSCQIIVEQFQYLLPLSVQIWRLDIIVLDKFIIRQKKTSKFHIIEVFMFPSNSAVQSIIYCSHRIKTCGNKVLFSTSKKFICYGVTINLIKLTSLITFTISFLVTFSFEKNLIFTYISSDDWILNPADLLCLYSRNQNVSS